jgi:hypothetical protein
VDTNKLSRVLKNHFETVLGQIRPVVADDKMGYSNKQALEYEAQKHWPVKVADVQFGRNDGAVLRLQRLRGHLLHELQHETAHLEHHHGDFSERALNKVETHVHNELDRLEALDKKIAELESRPDIHNPACAFVTLETREAKLRALAAYPRSTLFYCCCQIKPSECCCCLEKRIRAELPILDAVDAAEEGEVDDVGEEAEGKVGGAGPSKYLQDTASPSKPPPLYRVWLSTRTPAPENILWQNLTIGRASRCFRISLSCLITVVLLLATIGGSILVKNQTLKMSREYPSVDCVSLTKAVAVDKLTGEPTGKGITLEDALLDEMQIERINATTFEPKNVKLGLLGCYCSEHIQDAYTTEFVPAAFNVSTAEYPIPEGYVENGLFGLDYRKTWCVKWVVDSTQKQGLSIASVLIIVIVNMMLKMVMKRLVNMEAPISQSDFSESLMTKLTIFQFMNTALVTMLVNANLNDFSTGETDLTLNGLLFNGDYSDISKSWHVYIGTALLLTMMINLTTPLIFYWFLPCFRKIKSIHADSAKCKPFCCFKCCRDPKFSAKETQTEYEAMFMGGPFGLPARYALSNMVTGVTLSFGTSTPLLYPLAVVFFVMQYWADKYTFCRVARIPERTDAAVATASSSLIAPFVIIRLLISSWTFSNSRVWQGVNIIDAVIKEFVKIIGVEDNASESLSSSQLASALTCGTGTFGYILLRAILYVPHVFVLTALIIVWLIVDRCIRPTMGAFILGLFPCACCSNGDSGLDDDDNLREFSELRDSDELIGAEEFNFMSLEVFQDEIATDVNEDAIKKQIVNDIEERRRSITSNSDLAETTVEDVAVEEATLDDSAADKAEALESKFETVETSSDETVETSSEED